MINPHYPPLDWLAVKYRFSKTTFCMDNVFLAHVKLAIIQITFQWHKYVLQISLSSRQKQEKFAAVWNNDMEINRWNGILLNILWKLLTKYSLKITQVYVVSNKLITYFPLTSLLLGYMVWARNLVWARIYYCLFNNISLVSLVLLYSEGLIINFVSYWMHRYFSIID